MNLVVSIKARLIRCFSRVLAIFPGFNHFVRTRLDCYRRDQRQHSLRAQQLYQLAKQEDFDNPKKRNITLYGWNLMTNFSLKRYFSRKLQAFPRLNHAVRTWLHCRRGGKKPSSSAAQQFYQRYLKGAD